MNATVEVHPIFMFYRTIEDIAQSSRKNATMPGGPELKEICKKLIKDHFPHYEFTAVELLLNKHGHLVIWGVTSRPQYQAIELMWAYAKNHVSHLWDLIDIL